MASDGFNHFGSTVLQGEGHTSATGQEGNVLAAIRAIRSSLTGLQQNTSHLRLRSQGPPSSVFQAIQPSLTITITVILCCSATMAQRYARGGPVYSHGLGCSVTMSVWKTMN
eukprot:409468-Amphidinium_carterae.1